ncbi:MAG TPA: hypothetical protein PKC40_03745 [Saprospiraceae bacterium]|nr:hypothetical protein [Saprospiraceae bacterium]
MKTLLVAIVLLGCISNNVQAQIFGDSVWLNHVSEKIKALREFQNETINQQTIFKSVSSEFYFIKTYSNEEAMKLLDFVLKDNFLPIYLRHKFLVDNFKYFDPVQIRQIRDRITEFLRPSDFYYHILVSYFHVSEEIPYLKTHTSDSIFFIIKKDVVDNKIEKWNLTQLRNLTTLYNLEYRKDEDWFLSEINDLYAYLYSPAIKRYRLFWEVLLNSINIMNSKKAITSTLYLIDAESNISSEDLASDIASYPPDQGYFNYLVAPKLKSFAREEILALDFEASKQTIKQRILEDNSIWLDYIKIENK